MTASVHGRGLSVLIRDPWCVFLFWNDFVQSAIEDTPSGTFGGQNFALLLVQNHTRDLLQKIPVNLHAQNYYLPVFPGEHYTLTLGFSTSADGFQPFSTTVEVRMPAYSAAASGIQDDPASSRGELFFYPRFSLTSSISSSGEGR